MGETRESLFQELTALRKHVAELEKTQAKFEQLTKKYETTLGSITDGFVSFDQEWRYTYVNDSALRLLQKSREELLGRTPWEVFPESSHLKFYTEFTRSCNHNTPLHFEEFYPEPLNRWFECHCYPEPEGLSVYFQDVTDRKQTEEALVRAKETWERTLASVPDLIAIIDNQHKVERVNEAMARRLGIKTEEAVGRWCYEVVHGLSEPPDFCPHSRTMKDGLQHIEEVHEDRLGGDFVVSTTPLRDDQGQMIGAVHVAHDITERKKAAEALRRAHDELENRVEERTYQLNVAYKTLQSEMEERKKVEEQLRESQKMEAIGTLAGGIAHDFNNILAGILGFTEMAMEDIPPEHHAYRHLGHVLKGGMRGRELVKQILAFSRKTSYARSPISLSPLITETIHLLRASIPTTIHIAFTMTATSDTVLAAPIEVQQILMNLATNASLAMRETGGTLEISLIDIDFAPDSTVLEPDVLAGEYVQLIVKDTGTGMSPEVMKRIFEPFFTTREVGKGTGMGLAIVYGVVKDLHGTITVESEAGNGSTFRVSLPKIKTEPKEEQFQTIQIHGGTESILFVDDEDMLAEWGQAVLERLGYSVTTLTDATQALRTFSSDPSRFDLVITDQAMPAMTGVQLAKDLLKIRPDIPIILYTGHSETVSPETAKKVGIRQFLMKPLIKQELAQAVRRVLDGPLLMHDIKHSSEKQTDNLEEKLSHNDAGQE